MRYILLRYHPNPLTCNMRLSSDAFAPWRRAYSRGLSHMGFYAAAANCASSRHSILRLWRGPSPRAYARGLSHIGFHAAATNCASSRHSILRLWRGPSPRAYSRGLSHIGFHAAATNCASSRHSILRLWRGPSPRAYSRGIISHALLCRCNELCLFEALHPAPLARPFSKGLLEGDYFTWTFIPLRRVVPLRGTLSCAFGAALLQGPTRGRNILVPSHSFFISFSDGVK